MLEYDERHRFSGTLPSEALPAAVGTPPHLWSDAANPSTPRRDFGPHTPTSREMERARAASKFTRAPYDQQNVETIPHRDERGTSPRYKRSAPASVPRMPGRSTCGCWRLRRPCLCRGLPWSLRIRT